MKFELVFPESQEGIRLTRGAKFLLDGQELRHVRSAELLVHAGDIIRLKICQFAVNEEGHFYLIGEGEEQQVATINRTFSGSFTLTGEVQELVEE